MLAVFALNILTTNGTIEPNYTEVKEIKLYPDN
ncbi:hypothetical protein Cylst_3884 [Cylindrospermum stagnale PCC 7417]|uniref:Uncharacterized protein n=1 Tax=Cylindrospermum stagnale PCC 7417 TaxID=56107 RepID=K9X2R2_9NOST|nr:hypothetical protein Cylst_3884 [Cylindrospermum stagnale PCC 7417]